MTCPPNRINGNLFFDRELRFGSILTDRVGVEWSGVEKSGVGPDISAQIVFI